MNKVRHKTFYRSLVLLAANLFLNYLTGFDMVVCIKHFLVLSETVLIG